jgi:hypothetical protein
LSRKPGAIHPEQNRRMVPVLLARAEQLRAAIPAELYDYDAAKAAVLRQTTL